MRAQIAQDAARIMAEEGVNDFHAAKRKAAARLGASDTRNMPRNVEIEAALRDYQRIFQGDSHAASLERLRESAQQAMRYFEQFQPRLFGSVLKGTAGGHSDINLQLFADTPEEVLLFLMEQEVPFESGERMLRFSEEQEQLFPSYRILANEVSIELVVLPLKAIRQPPLSPVDGRPMERASLNRLTALMVQEEAELPG
ncbi:hypothetical protein BOW53_00170 [Solemya pervernicosa gill symbiont]|uniref:Nucleotidyltransferase n=3 Tax=Gammaproteobacteria incertae sedis TaxID=118884 RepID=A0A1T2LB17_9GAMM|nr:hypothetical protein [Candidatus Reidiella endopervernicosa]OOZ42295.1 hypothetical protein BOW53_00170 [Solemya pervernicosa gill symbiont]QKQ25691.1 hypothetical protein HUE57_04840 [Candidatus Reidiella endopervernicosa]